MGRRLIVAVLAGAVSAAVPAAADFDVKIDTLYEGPDGWWVEYTHSTDDPDTEMNEAGRVCSLWASVIAKENRFTVSIAQEPALKTSVAFVRPQFAEVAKGPLGNATIDIDGAKFTGAARRYSKVVSIDPLSPQGFLKAMKNGHQLIAKLPVVTPDTWSFTVEEANPALDAFAKCVKDNLGKDAYSLL